MKPRLFPLLAALALSVSATVSALAADAAKKKIVFLAGPNDHGAAPAHRYLETLEGIKYAFDHSTNVKNIATTIYALKAGQNYTAIDLKEFPAIAEADVIVVNSSVDRLGGTVQETHAIFPYAEPVDATSTTAFKPYTPEQAARLAQFDALMKKGVGLVFLHYSDNIRHPDGRKYMLDWLGGYHESNFSRTLVQGGWEMGLTSPQHPISRGVKPWQLGSEEFNLVQRLPDDPRRTALFTAQSPTAAADTPGAKPDPIGWAVQRTGGGRGFVYTGLHYHAYLSIPENRTAILNGIAWAAHIEIPAEGVQAPLPEGFPTSVPVGRGRGGPGARGPGTAPGIPGMAPAPAPGNVAPGGTDLVPSSGRGSKL